MTLEAGLEAHGLYLLSVARLSQEEIETYDLPVELPSVALVGNIGSSYWKVFRESPEYADGEADPLDRWSKRVAAEIAGAFPVKPIFPSDGPPYFPFQRWAQRAEGLEASPLGILMHPSHGLWHSFRFALLCDREPSLVSGIVPCRDCATRPCLQTCPVDAVSERGYDFERCADYLLNNADAPCHSQGCLARYACPVSKNRQYFVEQSRFHLRAFLKARS